MNLKGSSIFLGEGHFVSAAYLNGLYHVFLKSGGAICHKTYDPEQKVLKTVDNAISYADLCLLCGNTLAEVSGGRLNVETK